MKKKYIISGLLIAVVATIILLGTQTELLQGKITPGKLPTNPISKQRSFNITNIDFDRMLIVHSETEQKLNIDLSMRYLGNSSLHFDTDYYWKLRCYNKTISEIDASHSVMVTFPTGSATKVLTSGDTVTSRGALILSQEQLRYMKEGDGNISCGFANNKPNNHNNVSYGFANKRMKKSYQIHINDDNTVEVN